MEKSFVRTHSVLDLTISITLIISGLSFISLPSSQSINVLGFFILTSGFIALLVWKSGYKDAETGERYSKKEHFFARSERNHIIEAIDRNELRSINYNNEDKGNGLRIDIYTNNRSQKTYVQVFEYIPYKYEPCSAQYEFSKSEL